MVINSTHINKTNNLLSSYLNTKQTTIYHVGNQGPGLGQEQNVAVLNRLMGFQLPSR